METNGMAAIQTHTVYGPIELLQGREEQFGQAYSDKSVTEVIIGSAILHPAGIVYAVIRKRHFHVIAAMDVLGEAGLANTRFQGFLTNHGRYLNRKEAMELAKTSKQAIIKKGGPADELFSEDLWHIV